MGKWCLGILVALGLFAGCLSPNAADCAGGGVCPSGLRCAIAGDRQVCVPPTCGNGVLDPGEACDDGNNISGDGCPAGCGPPCGDGILDPGEACDDGNTAGGDGCSADCRSNESCGNGILDPGEACDDADLQDHDGCSSRCLIEHPAWSTLDDGMGLFGGIATYDAARGVTVLVQNNVDVPVRTWEWDGVAWRARSSVTVPPAMGGPSLIYDAGHRRVLEIGFTHSGWAMWAWDGIDWAQQLSGEGPPLSGFSIAYDARRNKVVLFGGELVLPFGTEWQNNTWEWDGTTWREIITLRAPPPRGFQAMAYDARRGVIVVYGGDSDLGVRSDVWEYDGVNWTRHPAANAPPPPIGASMTFDAARGTVVMFGGFGAAPGLWEWDGTHWTVHTSSSEPLPRTGLAMAYDIARDRVVLLGGGLAANSPNVFGALDDTWEWDGTAWSNRAVRTLARQAGGMIYDSLLGKTVLFGGDQLDEASPGAGVGLLNDIWRWDGTNWVADPPPSAFPPTPGFPPFFPPPRMAFATAFDGRETVLFGGLGANDVALADTWALSGANWRQVFSGTFPEVVPPARSQHAMAYDTARSKLILFGGAARSGDAIGDTWALDFNGWVQASPAHAPPPRQGHAMAYDSARQVVMMFGGQTGTALLGDTWTWDGMDWTAQTPLAAPSARRGHALAFDATRGKLVLFGGTDSTGVLADTWEWDGTNWLQRTPATAPPARSAHMMAYDLDRGRVVLFGGVDASHPLDDVWEWDGTNWQRVRYAASPPARSRHVMTYDTTRATALMFGGLSRDGGRRLNDTWVWDGSQWHDAEPAVAPPPRAEHALAFDSTRGNAVLFGGADADPRAADGVTRLGDTWEWDGARWVEQHPATSPPTRRGHSMVYDAARGKTLLFGGNQVGGLLADQWAWDGTNWTDITPAIAPPRRTDFSLAYDEARQRVVLFGGQGDSGRLGDVWEWDGSTWSDRTPPTVYVPEARSGATMAYNAPRRRIVVFGGQGETASLNDSWEWDGTTWTPLAPASLPSPRHHQAMACDAARGDLVMFGGDDGSVLGLSDTWLLRYEDRTMSSDADQSDRAGDRSHSAGSSTSPKRSR